MEYREILLRDGDVIKNGDILANTREVIQECLRSSKSLNVFKYVGTKQVLRGYSQGYWILRPVETNEFGVVTP